MKNCNEMVNSLLKRREEYLTKQEARKKLVIQTAIPICSLCVAALLGVGIWHSGVDAKIELSTPQSSVGSSALESTDNTISSHDAIDVIGTVKVNGVNYVQCSTATQVYTPDICLGNASDFEGTYQTFLRDSADKLYTTREDSDVLMVKLNNGDYVILISEEN